MWKHNDCFETWRWDVESWLKMVNCPCQPIRGQGLLFGPIRSRESWRLTNERTWDDEDAFWMRVNIGVICNRALWLIGCSCQSGAVCPRSCRHRLMSRHCCGDCSPCDDCCTLINITDMEHLSGEWELVTVSGSVQQLDRCSCLTSNWDFREKHCWSYFFCEGRKELIIYQNFDHVLLRFYLVSISWKWRHLSDTLISGSSEMPV